MKIMKFGKDSVYLTFRESNDGSYKITFTHLNKRLGKPVRFDTLDEIENYTKIRMQNCILKLVTTHKRHIVEPDGFGEGIPHRLTSLLDSYTLWLDLFTHIKTLQ